MDADVSGIKGYYTRLSGTDYTLFICSVQETKGACRYKDWSGNKCSGICMTKLFSERVFTIPEKEVILIFLNPTKDIIDKVGEKYDNHSKKE